MITKSKVKSQKSKLLSFFKTYHLSLITYHFKSGQLIIISLIFLTVVMILSASLFGRTARFLRFGGNSLRNDQATNLAEAGVDYAIWKLNEDPVGTYQGTQGTPVAVGTTGEFEIQITTQGNLKKIVVNGYVPNKADYKSKRTIKFDSAINTTDIAFNYAIQTGSGGINMSGNSRINNGNVYAGCAGCTPANIIGSSGATINGDAYATGPTITSAPALIVTGTRNPNQTNPPALPTLDYQAWRDAAGSTTCDADGIISSIVSIGPCKQTGNLTISGSSTVVTVQGPIYITGNFGLSGSSKLNLDNSFGSNDTVMIVDGTITISGNSQVNPTSSKGFILLATTSTSATAMSLSGGSLSGIFYVLEGTANLSGGVHLTGLVAKTVSMSGNSTLDYDIGLASSQFSSGPGGSWQVKKGTYRFTSGP